jgi:hypothetical protein
MTRCPSAIWSQTCARIGDCGRTPRAPPPLPIADDRSSAEPGKLGRSFGSAETVSSSPDRVDQPAITAVFATWSARLAGEYQDPSTLRLDVRRGWVRPGTSTPRSALLLRSTHCYFWFVAVAKGYADGHVGLSANPRSRRVQRRRACLDGARVPLPRRFSAHYDMRPVPPDTSEPAARPVDACPSARAATGILSGKVRPPARHICIPVTGPADRCNWVASSGRVRTDSR